MIGASRGFQIAERCLLAAGVLLLGVWAAAFVHGSVGSRVALAEFEKARIPSGEGPGRGEPNAGIDGEPDFSRWAKERARGYRESHAIQRGSPLAILRIARLNIRVPVFEGTDELALNRGVGWIAGTARPGEAGNVGIAGHRDGFFRALKDASRGDSIELSTARETRIYNVDQIELVAPDNVSVLRPRRVPSLTLVTCYPFYFIGDAPQRMILHAALKEVIP